MVKTTGWLRYAVKCISYSLVHTLSSGEAILLGAHQRIDPAKWRGRAAPSIYRLATLANCVG